MGWDDVQQRGTGSNASYLTFKDGDVHKVHIIDDEPFSFSSVFFNAIKKSAVVDPNDNPVKGVKGFDVRKRHAINVFDYDDSKVKVLAGSNDLFDQLKAIHGEWGGFGSVDLKITRHGTGFDTKYQPVITKECEWDESLMAGQELHDLPTLFAPTPDATVESYMQGLDPSTEFDPEKIENGDNAAVADDVVGEGELPLEDVVDEVPAPRTPPARTAARPAAKPPVKAAPAKVAAPAGQPLGRNELIMKLNALAKTKARYKKQGQWLVDVKKFGGADKQSMSQLGVDALTKLLAFVRTVK